MRKHLKLELALAACLVICGSAGALAQAGATPEEQVDARADLAVFARQLGSEDALVRQNAAEALARLAAVDQKKLVEGYQLQEKKKNVRLALDWALYRMGKSEALFRIVRELDSGRHEQAVSYLRQLDSPVLLYPFLKQEDNPVKITVGLLEALANLGEGETLELIKPFRDSFYPGVAEAAEVATDKIETRLAQMEPAKPIRPRTVGKTGQTSP